ncbi:helix-turn-helix transcriptional regulator [Sorangium sp. So ce260]|uniref:helix-turn-helix domain-containing protein n=1 Tax=Sorangium sp. So ce260 TaxID=3133291 RepID=UPI003F63C3B8
MGRRIRQLREEAGLTLEKLAFEIELGSKGHLSNIERGLVRPTIQTLQVLADRLGVLLLDLVTFPEDDDRQKLIDRTRSFSRGTLRKLVKELEDPGAGARRQEPKERRGGRTGQRIE